MAWCAAWQCIVVAGGCGPAPLKPHERILIIRPSARTWQYTAPAIITSAPMSLSPPSSPPSSQQQQQQHAWWYQQSLMLNHTLHCTADGELVIVMGGGNCFSFGTHFDRRVLRFRLSDIFSTSPSSFHPSRHFVQGFDPLRVSAAQFKRGIVGRRLPALFPTCTFGAASEWTPEALAAACGGMEASAHVTTHSHLNFLTRNFRFEVMSMPDLIQRVFNSSSSSSSPSKPKELLYLRSMGKNFRKDVADISVTHPQLFQQFELPPCFPPEILGDAKFSTALRLSSAGVQLWTHYDIMDNVLFNIVGRKRVLLFPPSQVDNLYVQGSTSAVVDVECPDYSAFPRFRTALHHAIEVVLEPGDALFMPAMWFHNVRALTPCVSINAFFRHLPAERYQRKDLYGNKDLPEACRAMAKVDAALKAMEAMEGDYRDFYLRKLRAMINVHLDAACTRRNGGDGDDDNDDGDDGDDGDSDKDDGVKKD